MPNPPTPPPNFPDSIAAQIKYLEQSSQYQYEQWQKTEEKLMALKHYLALELDSEPDRAPIADFFSLKAKKSEDSSVDIGSTATEEGNDSNPVEEKTFRTNGKTPQQHPDSKTENIYRSPKADSGNLPKNIETVPVEKIEQEQVDRGISSDLGLLAPTWAGLEPASIKFKYPPSTRLNEAGGSLTRVVEEAMSKNPDGVSTAEILRFLYPDGLEPELKRKIYDRIYFVFKSGCKNGSIQKVGVGLFAASTSSSIQTPVEFSSTKSTSPPQGSERITSLSEDLPSEEARELGDGRWENNFKVDSSNSKFEENNANKKLDRLKEPSSTTDFDLIKEAKLFERIKGLGGYAGVVRTAMAERVNRETNAKDICNWLNPNLPDTLKLELAKKLSKELSKQAKLNDWDKIRPGGYLLPGAKPPLDLTSELTFSRLSPIIANFLKQEPGAIVSLDYLILELFGQIDRDTLNNLKPPLRSHLETGVSLNLWDKVPDNKDCWTSNLALLPDLATKN